MTKFLKFFLFASFVFVAQQSTAQVDEINRIIKSQAEDLANATLEGDYEKLIDYTHPNVIKSAGGKENFLKFIVPEMQKMAADGFVMESVEIGEPTKTRLYKGQYQSLIPKTITIVYNGQRIRSKNHLFGFSDSSGQKWTFIEAEKLLTATGKSLFPDFETNINIPPKEAPITTAIDEDETREPDANTTTTNEAERSETDTDKEVEETVTVPEFDENAGTYDHADELIDTIFGTAGLIIGGLFILAFIVAMIFLFLYLRKKNSKQDVPATTPKPERTSKVKITCTECSEENSSDAKYCAYCGFTLPR